MLKKLWLLFLVSIIMVVGCDLQEDVLTDDFKKILNEVEVPDTQKVLDNIVKVVNEVKNETINELTKDKNVDTSVNEFLPATVERVIDGDTIVVNFDPEIAAQYGLKTQERVRWLLIDTPESVHSNTPIQPFGPESSDRVKGLIPAGSKVKIELDESYWDRYDRLLGYVWSGDVMLNELLVEEGLARVAYVIKPSIRHVDRLSAAQERAKDKKVNIWSIEGYVTDKGFDETVVK